MMKPIVREIIQIVVLALVVFFALHFLIQNFRIEGTSMEPNLHDSQYILVNKTAYWFGKSPKRGDIIVFQAPDQPQYDRIKRVIGLPGETVEVKQNGSVFIDGQFIEEPYVVKPGGPSGTWEVPENEYFVMGDNRTVSYDSRNGGPIPKGNIVGRAWLVIWPISNWGFAPHTAISFASIF
ncbi:MAG: signal peptidase I [Dehalococcoidia bacterium]|nr:MAG: signal peptidase I [Dehalococcoidia bacterium]